MLAIYLNTNTFNIILKGVLNTKADFLLSE